MKPLFESKHCTLYHGGAHAVSWHLPEQSVHTVVTSPPYYGLRDYGVEGQIGLEETPTEYVEKLVTVFSAVRRVLRDDGTLWLNLGDSYANDGKWGGQAEGKHCAALHCSPLGRNKKYTGFKSKDLMGIPWMVAFALRADGWYLRSDIIWAKPNPMPESVTDRPTKAHEYLFLLSKSERYFYDHEAVMEPLAEASASRYGYAFGGAKSVALVEANKDGVGQRTRVVGDRETPSGRNRRSVWTVATKPFKGAHFAVFPPALIEPCILAGCPAGGTVLDPFAGSGTTGEVSVKHGRNFVGIELNADYCKLAIERIERAEEDARSNLPFSRAET